jgi:hypothetical protein
MIWRTSIGFDKLIVVLLEWNSFGKVSVVTLGMKKYWGNAFCTCVLWKGKMVEEFLCVLCAFILLGGVKSNVI